MKPFIAEKEMENVNLKNISLKAISD